MPSISSRSNLFRTIILVTKLVPLALVALAACSTSQEPPTVPPTTTISPTRIQIIETPALSPSTLRATEPTTPAPTFSSATATRIATRATIATIPSATSSATLTALWTAPAATPLPSQTPTVKIIFPANFHGDAVRGAELFKTMQCARCHIRPGRGRAIAPELGHFAADAQEIIRRPDYHGQATTAAQYIYESILNPNAYVLPPFGDLTPDSSSIMPKDFSQRLNETEIENLVTYLLTLH